jgi:RimJ/RimL family protein N-acetyltransferase
MNQPTLETKRLILRPFLQSDAKDVQRLAGNKSVSQYTLNIPFPYEDGMAEKWISSQENRWDKREEASFAIVEKTRNRLLGSVGLVKIKDKVAEMGYWIGEPYWNQGYCTEAARQLIEYAFTSLDLDSITAEHLSDNPASGSVMKKLGMRHCKRIFKPDRYGNTQPLELYEVSRASRSRSAKQGAPFPGL